MNTLPVMPAFSGVAHGCSMCGYPEVTLRYYDSGEMCRVDAKNVRQQRMCRNCKRCGHHWDECTLPQTTMWCDCHADTTKTRLHAASCQFANQPSCWWVPGAKEVFQQQVLDAYGVKASDIMAIPAIGQDIRVVDDHLWVKFVAETTPAGRVILMPRSVQNAMWGDTDTDSVDLAAGEDNITGYPDHYIINGSHSACHNQECRTKRCPYDYHDPEVKGGIDMKCVCEPHRCGAAHGCPEGCPTHNPGGPDVPSDAGTLHPDLPPTYGGPATDDEENQC